MGSDSSGRGLKGVADVVGDSQKQDAKNPQEVIHWHNRWVLEMFISIVFFF